MATGVPQQHQDVQQERLKEQVSVSVKEALEKTTDILSNLHRVQSYLYVLRTVSSASGAEGFKNALQQMHAIRKDTATLLQTVYLAEIGIQSLQDSEKEGVVGSTPFPPFTLDLGSDNSSDEGVREGRGKRGVVSDGVNSGHETPAKRSKLSSDDDSQATAVISCSQCGRKFASQSSPSPESSAFLCRACRQNPGHAPEAILPPRQQLPPQTVVPSGNNTFSSEKRKNSTSSTPRGGNKGGRGNMSRMSCKLCGASFLYKRCLHRHIREHHSELELDNLAQYIQVDVSANDAESPAANDSSGYVVLATPTQQQALPPTTLVYSADKALTRDDEEERQVLASITAEMGVSPIMDSGAGLEGIATPTNTLKMGGGEGNDNDATPQVEGGESEKYECPTCGKVFDRPYRYQRHLQIHNPNRPKVSCQLCNKTFTRMDTLENHMKCLHSNDRPFKCTFPGCPKRFPLQSALVHHLKIHMDGKPYKCNECDDASFALLGEFRAHIAEAHADTKDVRCSECYKVFGGAEELRSHVRLEHRLECEVCMRTFSRLAYLQAHIEIHNGPAVFNCRYCDSGFDSEYSYKKHLKTHSKQSKSSRASHPCNVCDVAFQDAETLMAHYRTEEHQEKVATVGLDHESGPSILHSIEGELSSDIRSLVDEVAGSIGAAEVMQSINDREMLRAATVTIDPVEGGVVYQPEVVEPQFRDNREGVSKRVHFKEPPAGVVYGRENDRHSED